MLQSKRREDGVIKGTLFLTLSTLIVKLLGVIYKIPLSNYLGDEGMGYFNSAYTVFSFFYIICTAGVPKAVMILTTASRTEKRGEESLKTVKCALSFFFFLGSLMTILLIIFAPALSSLIGSKKAMMTIVSIAPSVLFVSVAGVIRGKLTADMNFLSISVSSIIEALGRLLFGLFFAYMGIEKCLSVEMVSALTILGVTLGAFFGLVYLYFTYKKAESKEKSGQNAVFVIPNKLETIKRLFKISMPITLSASVMSLTNIIDLGLIMRRLKNIGYSEIEAAGLYGNYTTLAVSMFNLAIALITPISVAFLPVFTRCFAKKDTDGAKDSLFDCLKLSSLIGMPLMLGMMFYSEEILTLIFKNTEIKLGAELLLLLSPSVFLMFVLLAVNSFLEAMGEVKAPMYSMLCGCAVKTAVCYFLVSSPYFGIFAAPIGTVACYSTALIVSMFFVTKKKGLSIPLFSALCPSFVNSLTALIFSVPIHGFLLKRLDFNMSTVIIILIVAIIYISLTVLSGCFNLKQLKKMANYTKTA